MSNVVVIGGGISGLAAALRAAELGHDVQVLEANDRLGGVLAPVTLAFDGREVTVDAGAESVLNARPEGTDLIRAAGLEDHICYPDTTHALIAGRGSLHPMPAKTVMGVPTAETDLSGILNAQELATFERLSQSAGAPLPGDVSVAELITERCGRAVVDHLVEPLLGGVYAGHSDELSAQATIARVWEALTRGGSLRDTLRSAHGTVSRRETPIFAGVRGGLWQIPAALEQVLTARAVRVARQTPATGLSARDKGGWLVDTGSGELAADHVVVALQPPPAASLLGAAAPVAAELLAGVPMGSMALVTVIVRGQVPLPGGLEGASYSGFLVPPIEGYTVKAATFSHAKWRWVADAVGPDYGVVRLSLGRAGESETLARSNDELVHTALDDLAQLIGSTVDVAATHVTRWTDALPQYTVGHNDRTRAIARDCGRRGGLHYAGSLMGGVGIATRAAHALSLPLD